MNEFKQCVVMNNYPDFRKIVHSYLQEGTFPTTESFKRLLRDKFDLRSAEVLPEDFFGTFWLSEADYSFFLLRWSQ